MQMALRRVSGAEEPSSMRGERVKTAMRDSDLRSMSDVVKWIMMQIASFKGRQHKGMTFNKSLCSRKRNKLGQLCDLLQFQIGVFQQNLVDFLSQKPQFSIFNRYKRSIKPTTIGIQKIDPASRTKIGQTSTSQQAPLLHQHVSHKSSFISFDLYHHSLILQAYTPYQFYIIILEQPILPLIFTKMEAFNLFTTIYTFIQQNLASGSLAIVNHLLQALFFTFTVTYLIGMLLHLVNFAYAKSVAESRLVQAVSVLMMWYMKIWDHYSGLLYISSVFSLAIVSIYVYDCCGNISQHYDNWCLHNRDWAIISSFTLMFATTAYIFYSVHKDAEDALNYDYSGIYLLMVLVVLIGNMLRRRSVIYTLMGVLVMNYLVASRYFLSVVMNEHLQALATLPYFMMALQAEHAERNQVQAESLSSFFKASASMAAFSLLNDPAFPLELTVGGVFILGIVINR